MTENMNVLAAKALSSPEVKSALFNYEQALAKRNSISRKLCGGSTHVTVEDLALWEEHLASTSKILVKLADHCPLLERDPIIAELVVRKTS